MDTTPQNTPTPAADEIYVLEPVDGLPDKLPPMPYRTNPNITEQTKHVRDVVIPGLLAQPEKWFVVCRQSFEGVNPETRVIRRKFASRETSRLKAAFRTALQGTGHTGEVRVRTSYEGVVEVYGRVV